MSNPKLECAKLTFENKCVNKGCNTYGNTCCVFCEEFKNCISNNWACNTAIKHYKRNRSLYQAAIDAFGKESRLDIAQEELAELIQAISKYRRGGDDYVISGVLSEIADVEIMIAQLKLVLGVSEEYFEAVKSAKEDKLRQLIAQTTK